MPPTLTLTQSAEEQEAEQQPQAAEELMLSSQQAKFDTFLLTRPSDGALNTLVQELDAAYTAPARC